MVTSKKGFLSIENVLSSKMFSLYGTIEITYLD